MNFLTKIIEKGEEEAGNLKLCLEQLFIFFRKISLSTKGGMDHSGETQEMWNPISYLLQNFRLKKKDVGLNYYRSMEMEIERQGMIQLMLSR